MKKASEYREHANQCRMLARSAQNEEQRNHLEEIARIWEKLAEDREHMLAEQVELDKSEPQRS